MLTKVKLNGTVLLTREDDHGNFWIHDCPENRAALKIQDNNPKAIFGSCIVGPHGSERAARENSISYFTLEAGAEIVWLEKVLEQHEITENVRRTIAQKSFRRMKRMNTALPPGFKLAVVPV